MTEITIKAVYEDILEKDVFQSKNKRMTAIFDKGYKNITNTLCEYLTGVRYLMGNQGTISYNLFLPFF